MLTREPSFSRASTIGLDSSTRRPTAAAMRWQMLTRCPVSRKRTADCVTLPPRSTKIRSGPFTMMSAMLSSSSSVSSGPRPTMSLTSSAASARCSRALSWMRRSVATALMIISTAAASLTRRHGATAAGSIWARQMLRNSAIASGGADAVVAAFAGDSAACGSARPEVRATSLVGETIIAGSVRRRPNRVARPLIAATCSRSPTGSAAPSASRAPMPSNASTSRQSVRPQEP